MKTLRARDIDMHYLDLGRGEPVLLIHGLGSSVRDWEHQLTAFARHHRVLACDLRGHGHSTRAPGPYSMRELSQDMRAAIEALAAEAVHVVGISLGGMIALQLALDHPELVRSLVIVNSGPAVVPRGLRQRLQVFQRRAALRLFGLRGAAKLIGKKLFPHPHQQALRSEFRQRWLQNDETTYRAAFEAIIGWSVRERLPELACPCLVVTGDRDYTSVAQKQAYLGEIADARLVVIEDSGHATPLDQPAAFNRAVLAFLSQQPSTVRRRNSGIAPKPGSIQSSVSVR